MTKKFHFDTIALHAGFNPADHNEAGAVPIYQSSAFRFPSAQAAADRFALDAFGNIYSRINNPTQNVFECRIAGLEGGVAALAVSSGMSAQFIAISNIASNGDNIISSGDLYGGTYNQFAVTFKKIGIGVKFFDVDSPESILNLVDKNTKAVYVESFGNPSLRIPDFEKISAITKKLGIPLIVDNTVTTPYLFRPFEHGANIVVHSATKFIGGHGTSIGGVIVDGGNFDWGQNDKFPGITQPSEGYHGLVYNERFGKDSPFGNIAFIIKARVEGLRDFGPCISPFNSFLFIQGIETLSLRLEKHTKNAQELAHYLKNHPKIAKVNYLGFEDNPYHTLAKKYFPKGTGSLFSFELKGGLDAGRKFVESVKICLHETNLGDSRTNVTHNASTTHQQLSSEDQKKAGVTPGLIRISVGLEDIIDLIDDFEQALNNV